MKKILITGATGYLGSYLFSFFSNRYSSVFGTYHTISKLIDRSLNLIQVELSDNKAVKKLINSIKPEVIIHTAAIADIDYCEKNPEEADQSNVLSTRNLVTESKTVSEKFIFISTEAVYDGNLKKNYNELDIPKPVNIYGKTKLKSELLVKDLSNTYLIARCARIVGFSGSDTNRQFDKLITCFNQNKSYAADSERILTPTWNRHIAEVILWWLRFYEQNLLCNLSVPEKTTYYDLLTKCKEKAKKFPIVSKKLSEDYFAKRSKNTPLGIQLLLSLNAPIYHIDDVIESISEDASFLMK